MIKEAHPFASHRDGDLHQERLTRVTPSAQAFD